MKGTTQIFIGICLCFFMLACESATRVTLGAVDSSSVHSDKTVRGIYVYESEPYTTTVDLEIKDGKIVDVKWVILDTMRHVPFDSTYERFMGNNAYYIDQCRKDWKGSRSYGPKLIQTQNIDSVDAVTGATWTHMLFKRAVEDALKIKTK
jgi:major membrane immunogen (membrane-anchored lipoprotein)